jgi:hypothetical protein
MQRESIAPGTANVWLHERLFAHNSVMTFAEPPVVRLL